MSKKESFACVSTVFFLLQELVFQSNSHRDLLKSGGNMLNGGSYIEVPSALNKH